jgi:tetratricopeptide (TPR) repeat protein
VLNSRVVRPGHRTADLSLHRFWSVASPVAVAFVFLCCAVFAPTSVQAQRPPAKPFFSEPQVQHAYEVGIQLVRQGQLDEAIRSFDKALAADPRNLVLLDAIGAAYSFKGEFITAEGFFLKALQLDPKFIAARKNLAITHFNLVKEDLAASEFQQLAGESKESQPVADLFLGMIAARRGEYEKAVAFSEKAGKLLYQYPDALISFADSLYRLHQPQRAELVLKHLDGLQEVTAAEHLKAGALYSQLGDEKHALADFDNAEKLGVSSDSLDVQRAAALDKLGRTQEALALLKARVAANPNAEALNLLAHVAEKNHEFALALQSLKMAAKLEPKKEENYLDFSTFCADYENYPLALDAAEIGLEHIPDSYRLQVQKGAVLEKLGRLEEAELILRKASALEADNSVALLSLGVVQSHAEKLQESADTLTAAIAKFPNNFYMHYYLGTVLAQLEERDGANEGIRAKAERAFREAIRLNATFADSYYQLSKLYMHRAPKLAEQNLVACLKLDPDHAPAEYTLGRFYLKTGRRAEGQALIDRFESQQQAAKAKEQNQPRIAAAQ